MAGVKRWWCVVLGLGLLCAGQAAAALAESVQPAVSWAGFSMKTRWGQTLQGRFPVVQGEVLDAGEGRKRVKLRFSARDVEIIQHRRFTQLTRGDGFFDADNHPFVEFVSDAYPAGLLREGGQLAGDLTIRGATRREVFTIDPANCERAGIDCDVFATGVVYRSDFGMDRWSFALSDRVQMTLRLRIGGGG